MKSPGCTCVVLQSVERVICEDGALDGFSRQKRYNEEHDKMV